MARQLGNTLLKRLSKSSWTSRWTVVLYRATHLCQHFFMISCENVDLILQPIHSIFLQQASMYQVAIL